MSLFAKFDDIRASVAALTDYYRNPFDIRFEKILSPTEAILGGAGFCFLEPTTTLA